VTNQASEELLTPERVQRGRSLLTGIRQGIAQVIFGQDRLIDLTVIALAARGHVLLEGLPGLGKTELIKTLSSLMGLLFKRIQFTPDMLPSDITGGHILQEKDGARTLVFHEGPIFGNIVLADEINRASPKTQSALLEAMQERRVTALGDTRTLPDPFFVLATQNPIELEGTYPLPEAQLDRFLFKIDVPRAATATLLRIVTERRRGTPPTVERAITEQELRELFELVDGIFLPHSVAEYIARLVTASHRDGEGAPDPVKRYVRHGASPRAAIAIAESARASALLAGRPNVDFQDIEDVAEAAMAHRLVLDHAARIDGIDARGVVRELLKAVPVSKRPLPAEVA
jgi:MoxR-like ATPase